ncbi:hypothetical protein RJT34_23765 [Clitoria ternatea]|uniref:Late embryogenesis abundant protein LEA-2 subgroup domain-containing protein n=1 Tax=Clitoria ternatea TaxID=43366 RepID=A0AAN9FLU8_CLITE
MTDKQPQLNGAYYGPSIPASNNPPHQKHSHRRGRKCCCCLFKTLCCLLVSIILIIGVAILVFWLVVQPRSIKFHVTDAKLTQFNYTDNSTPFSYNLVLNFTARNPNKKLNYYYDGVEGHAFYDGVRLASTDVITWRNSFRQHAKSTDNMSGVFSGRRVVVLNHDEVSDFRKDERKRVFDIDVRLNFNIRFRLGDFIGGTTKMKAKCELEVPLSTTKGTTTVTAFQPTECHVEF